MSEKQRQNFVMMGPGFFSSGGSIFGPLIAFSVAGWVVAIAIGLAWWLA